MKKCKQDSTFKLCGTTNIGSKWQIVIPKEARDLLWLHAWDSVSFVVKDTEIIWIVPNETIDVLMDYISQEKWNKIIT